MKDQIVLLYFEENKNSQKEKQKVSGLFLRKGNEMEFYKIEKVNEKIKAIRSLTGEIMYFIEGEKKQY